MSGRPDQEKRAELIEQLCFGMIFGEDRSGATRLVDEYVHALAERLRDERPQYNPDWTCWGDAADLIDPAEEW